MESRLDAGIGFILGTAFVKGLRVQKIVDTK